MESSAQRLSSSSEARPEPSRWPSYLAWFGAGAVLAFLVPFVFSSLLDLQHDLYLAIYFAFVIALVAAFARADRIDPSEVLRRNWKWGVIAGVVVGIPVVGNVFTETETPHPDGLYFGFELLWRGVGYGVVDAVLLTVFPCLIAYQALRGPLKTWGRRAAYLLASIAMVLTITATYHLGYDHFREEGVAEPEIGNSLMSIPMLLTANPIGSVLDHGAMHVAAVIHSYEGETRLPPQTDAD